MAEFQPKVKHVKLYWIPVDVGIHENEKAGAAAKIACTVEHKILVHLYQISDLTEVEN